MAEQLSNRDSCIEDFNLIKKIGAGAYGEVWLSEFKDESNKKYVLKKIPLFKVSAKEREAAHQESRLLFRLKHPNIVQYKASFEHNSALYIAMAFCEGGDLYSRLKQQLGVALDERQVVEWFVQITMALQYMHGKNILHRDLKTQNIFLTKSRIIKVGDLGIARVLESPTSMATTMIGTPYYMSPELFARKPYNHKSDVWSLGCCVYEMATLKHAFNARDFSSLSLKIMQGKVPDMPSHYSPELLDLIRSMLNRDADKRPSVNRILRDPYIRKNIQIFLEGAKHSGSQRSGSKPSRPKTASSDSRVALKTPERNNSPVISKNAKPANDNRSQLPSRPRSAKEQVRREVPPDVPETPVHVPVRERSTSSDRRIESDQKPRNFPTPQANSQDSSKPPIRSKSPCGKVQPTELEKEIAKNGRFIPNSESTSSNEENLSVEASGDAVNHLDRKKKSRLESPLCLPEKENSPNNTADDSPAPDKPALHNSNARKERRQKRAKGLLPGLMLRNHSTPEKMEHVKQIVLIQKSHFRRHSDLSEIVNSPNSEPPESTPNRQNYQANRRDRTTSDSSDGKGKKGEESDISSVIKCMETTLTIENSRSKVSEEDLSAPRSQPRVRKISDSCDDVGPVEKQEDTLTRNTIIDRRMIDLQKDLVQNLGVEKLEAAYNIFNENIDETEFEPKLRDIFKNENEYKEYAQKIWQMKYWEDCRFS